MSGYRTPERPSGTAGYYRDDEAADSLYDAWRDARDAADEARVVERHRREAEILKRERK